MKSRSRKRGFTLVELLVVISIISIMLAIIAPSLNRCRGASKRLVCSNRLKEIARGVSFYADAYDNKMPFYGGWDPSFEPPYKCIESYPEGTGCKKSADDCCPRDYHQPYFAFHAVQQWCEGGDLDKPYPMKLGCLYRAGIITDARVFYCPANPDPFYQYESYVNPPPWGSLPQEFNTSVPCGQRVRIGYTYYPVDSTLPRFFNGEMDAPVCTARKYDKVDTRIPYLADVFWYRETMAHKTKDSYATNAAFKDTHVVYCNDQRMFSDDPAVDPQRLWEQWEMKTIPSCYFYYNFLKKIEP